MKEFEEYTKKLVNELTHRSNSLNKKKSELEAELNKIQNEIDGLLEKQKLVGSYPSQKNYCPRCFVFNNMTIEMKPVPSSNDTEIFKCSHCSSEIEVDV